MLEIEPRTSQSLDSVTITPSLAFVFVVWRQFEFPFVVKDQPRGFRQHLVWFGFIQRHGWPHEFTEI